MSISLICSFFLAAIVATSADKVQQQIWMKYIDVEEYAKASAQQNPNIEINVPRASNSIMKDSDIQISESCDFIQTYGILLISIAGSCIGILAFYRDKLKNPLEVLNNASNRIARDELDFYVTYRNKDEMGQLCQQFEKMRSQLEMNNIKMWNLVEQERTLRAAIAHDIRSPLAVLRGYQEMLLEFIPENQLDEASLMNMLKEGMGQIERLEIFVEAMRKLSSIEDRTPAPKNVNSADLIKQIREEVLMLSKDDNIVYVITNLMAESLCVDMELILEVVDNLLSNALRYAKNQIMLSISILPVQLEICVADDGRGFEVSEEIATKAFYHSNHEDDLKHSGLGMYLCKLYCEKHRGKLLLGNREQGGAEVKASFMSLTCEADG